MRLTIAMLSLEGGTFKCLLFPLIHLFKISVKIHHLQQNYILSKKKRTKKDYIIGLEQPSTVDNWTETNLAHILIFAHGVHQREYVPTKGKLIRFNCPQRKYDYRGKACHCVSQSTQAFCFFVGKNRMFSIFLSAFASSKPESKKLVALHYNPKFNDMSMNHTLKPHCPSPDINCLSNRRLR